MGCIASYFVIYFVPTLFWQTYDAPPKKSFHIEIPGQNFQFNSFLASGNFCRCKQFAP